MMVMVAVSTSLVLTYAFLRTQTTLVQISRNSSRRDWALQAAHAGAAVAVTEMSRSDWPGVSVSRSRVVHADSEGTAWYTVEFRPQANTTATPTERALTVVIDSVGTWESAEDARERVESRVEVVAQLQPRIRMSGAFPDEPHDVAPNPGDFDVAQRFAFFAEGGGASLVLDPGDRVDGDLWLNDDLQLYHDPHWSDAMRDGYLESIGRRFVSGTGEPFHAHPLAGRVTFYNSPDSLVSDDLARLGVEWQTAGRRLDLPTPALADWTTYRLYDGGFEYHAVELPDENLANLSEPLQPTAENPLGIFYRNGQIRVGSNVTVIGTLVANGDVLIQGRNVHLASFDWRGKAGHLAAPGAELWPRLPAVVAQTVHINRLVRVTIDGAVVTDNGLYGAGGDYSEMDVAAVTVAGKATCEPTGLRRSIVRLHEERNLSGIAAGAYTVVLGDDLAVKYPIVAVDDARNELTILGSVTRSDPVNYSIKKQQRAFVNIFGPVSGSRHDIKRPPVWDQPTEHDWSMLHRMWEVEQRIRVAQKQVPIEFVDYLADPAKFEDYLAPLSVYGLDLHNVTFLLRHRPVDADAGQYRWSPPVFESFDGGTDNDGQAGYRWKVISWREVQRSAAAGSDI